LTCSKDRVFAAIDLEEPDRVPLFDFIYENRSFENILGESVAVVTPDVYVRGYRALGLDLMVVGTDGPEKKRVSPGVLQDEWGIMYRETPDLIALPWFLEGPIKSPEGLDGYQMPDPEAPGRLRTIEAVMKLVGEEMAVATAFPIGGPFTAASFLTGFDRFLAYLVTEPGFAQRLLRIQTEYCLAIGKRCVEAGVKIVFINDDLGYVSGPFVSPSLFRRTVLPHLQRLTHGLKKRGAKVLLHCDGDIRLLLDDLVSMGIDGLHPIERKCNMSLKEVKERYGDRICLLGNVDASSLLPFGAPEEVKRQTLECIGVAGPGGGYILASDHSIHPSVPGEKARFMFQVAKRYGGYPIRRPA